MNWRHIILIAVPSVAAVSIIGLDAAAGDPDNDVIVYSYDTGDHTARVFAYCIGTTEVNLLGDTDEMLTWPDSSNCVEGGFLRDSRNDRNEEE